MFHSVLQRAMTSRCVNPNLAQCSLERVVLPYTSLRHQGEIPGAASGSPPLCSLASLRALRNTQTQATPQTNEIRTSGCGIYLGIHIFKALQVITFLANTETFLT